MAAAGVRALVALSPPDLPRVGAIRVDGAVFAFGLGDHHLDRPGVRVVPALQAARTDPHRRCSRLARGPRPITGDPRRAGRRRSRARARAAGQLRAAAAQPRASVCRPHGLRLVGAAHHAGARPAPVRTDAARRSGSSTQALDAVRQVPGVTAAGLHQPAAAQRRPRRVRRAFRATPTAPPRRTGAFRYAVSPGYIETMRIPLRRGRLFDARDRAGGAARRADQRVVGQAPFRGRDPIGQRSHRPGTALYTIVGVVGDVKQMSLALDESPTRSTSPAAQWRFADRRAMSLVVRAPRRRGGARAGGAAGDLVGRQGSADRQRVATMDDLLARPRPPSGGSR